MRRLTPFVVLVLLGAACSSDEATTSTAPAESEAAATTEATPTTTLAPTTVATTAPATTVPAPAPATTEATGDEPPPIIEVTAVDYAYEGLPDTVPRGTELTLVNASEVEFHVMSLLILNPNEDRSLEELAELSAFDLDFEQVGGLIGVSFARPGEAQYETVGGGLTLTQPGRYLVFCTVPVGADPAEMEEAVLVGPPQQVEGVPAHYQEGMIAEVTVE